MDQTSPLDAKTNILFEHRPGPIRTGSVNLLPFNEASQQPGFISVFGMTKEAQGHIRACNNTAGLRGLPLYTDLIYLDFDDAENDAADTETTLQRLGLRYEVYSTGRAGRFHFHVPCVPATRTDLPMRVAAWIGQNFKGYDPKIYMTSGVIRTVGTFHSKAPGKFKHLLHEADGETIDIMKATKDVMPKVYLGVGDSDVEAAEVLQSLWVEPCFEGGRNRQVYRRAYLAKIAGIDMPEAEELLRTWNELMVHPPLKDGEVITTVRSAYRG